MKYELRNGRNLHLNLPRTSTYGIDSLRYLAANIWTQVSLEIKQCKSLSLFKQKLRHGPLEFVPVSYVRHLFTMLVIYEAKCFLRVLYLN